MHDWIKINSSTNDQKSEFWRAFNPSKKTHDTLQDLTASYFLLWKRKFYKHLKKTEFKVISWYSVHNSIEVFQTQQKILKTKEYFSGNAGMCLIKWRNSSISNLIQIIVIHKIWSEMTLIRNSQFPLLLGLNNSYIHYRKPDHYALLNQGILCLIRLNPSIFAITNFVWRIIYLHLRVHHVLIMSTLKLMNMLMLFLRLFLTEIWKLKI